MFNILSSSFRPGRDEHGIGEVSRLILTHTQKELLLRYFMSNTIGYFLFNLQLLEAVSRRSSCNDHERQELSEMVRRVRTSKQQNRPNINKAIQGKVRESPSSSTHGSSNGSFRNGDDLHGEANPAQKVDLLRGFGSSPSDSSPSCSAIKPYQNRTTGILLRDFGPPLLSKNHFDDPMVDTTDDDLNQ